MSLLGALLQVAFLSSYYFGNLTIEKKTALNSLKTPSQYTAAVNTIIINTVLGKAV